MRSGEKFERKKVQIDEKVLQGLRRYFAEVNGYFREVSKVVQASF